MHLYDTDIREPLFDYLEETCGKIRIIEEKSMGKSRADVMAVLEDCIMGLEIKSDRDTYTRLSSQIKDYNKYFDRNTIVVGIHHALHVEEHVPEWWGILTAEKTAEGVIIREVRPSQLNPKRKMNKKIEILWRPELAELQRMNGLPAYKQKSKAFVQKAAVERIEEELLNRQISELLFERDYTTIEQQIKEHRKGRR